ncbi:MAG: radical SAM protein [Parcubacteria group bacterium Athens0714_25]|nr:MAG: radical SAM protein [Parcubacteria group bacterium Athens0714_25]
MTFFLKNIILSYQVHKKLILFIKLKKEVTMKIALVVPCGQKNMNAMGNVARPPLGACYLMAYLKANGYADVRVFHQIDETDEEMIEKIISFNPNVVGFSTMSCVFPNGVLLARSLKIKKPNIVTVFGGEHITGIFVDETKYGSSTLSQTLKNHPEIDFAVPFEGEITLLELVQTLKIGSNFSEVDGIAFIRNGELFATKSRQRISNLDTLPIADRSDLPYEKYHSIDESPFLEYLHTTRGCKFRCKYCATPISNPGKVVACSAERIIKEIQFLYDTFDRTWFFFCDELFTFDPIRVEKFCRGLIRGGLSREIHWRCFARVDDVSRGKINLALMKKAGCNGLFFGIESMNPETLRRLGKGTNPEQVKTAVETATEAGIDVWSSLMIGYPWETERKLHKSLNDYLFFVKKGLIKHTYVAFITPFPGTEFYRQCIKNDWIIRSDFLESDCSYPVLKTPLSKEVLIKIYQNFLSKV